MDAPTCPACFLTLPPLKPGERRLKCPRCKHVFAADDRDQQTGAHTPHAKRQSSRPPPRG